MAEIYIYLFVCIYIFFVFMDDAISYLLAVVAVAASSFSLLVCKRTNLEFFVLVSLATTTVTTTVTAIR